MEGLILGGLAAEDEAVIVRELDAEAVNVLEPLSIAVKVPLVDVSVPEFESTNLNFFLKNCNSK